MIRNYLLPIFTSVGIATASLVWVPGAIAQRVVNVSPAVNAERVSPDTSISGQFETDDGTGIDTASVTIRVNGEDVTRLSTITPNFFTYRPAQAFPVGPVDVQVEYESTEGAQRSVSWSFRVAPPQVDLEITSVTHNGTDAPLGPSANFLVTISGTPNAQASVVLVEDGTTVQELAAEEESAGVYVASATVESTDDVDEGIVIGRLTQSGTTVFGVAPQPVVFSPQATTNDPEPVDESEGESEPDTDPEPEVTAPLKPEFTSHSDGDTVSGRFVLSGQTQPNASVDVTVQVGRSVLGVINLGTTLVETTVTADSQGEFSVQVPRPTVPVPGLQYQVRAVASLDGTTSSPTELVLMGE